MRILGLLCIVRFSDETVSPSFLLIVLKSFLHRQTIYAVIVIKLWKLNGSMLQKVAIQLLFHLLHFQEVYSSCKILLKIPDYSLVLCKDIHLKKLLLDIFFRTLFKENYIFSFAKFLCQLVWHILYVASFNIFSQHYLSQYNFNTLTFEISVIYFYFC